MKKRKSKNIEKKVWTMFIITVISYIISVGVSSVSFTGMFAKTGSQLIALENIQERVVDGKCVVDFSVILNNNKEDKILESVYLNLESYNSEQRVIDQKMSYLGTIYGNSRVGWNDRLEVTCEENDDLIVVKLISLGSVIDEVFTKSVY